MSKMNTKSDVTKYDKKTPREHILLRPDTYIGDIEPTTEETWVYSEEDNRIMKKKITYSPGFLKIFDEILVNARDASVNDPTCDTIKVEYNTEEGYISIFNNGDDGIPIEEHPVHKMLIPTMIFGELLTSSNYDDDVKRVTGGKNGLGSKCLGSSESVLLFNGEKKLAKNICVNDILIGDDGTPRTVKNVIKGEGKLYEVSQSFGDKYIVNDEHILTLHMPDHKVIFWNTERQGWTVLWWNNEKKEINVKTVISEQIEDLKVKEELEDFCKTINDNNIFDISIKDYMKLDEITQSKLEGLRGQCVQWEMNKVELDPYELGLWLSNENTNYLQEFYSDELLSKYNLINNKHIPKEYLINDRDTRLKVLAGIIDGMYNNSSSYNITIFNHDLAKDIIYLTRSLGIFCEYNTDNTKYNINISGEGVQDIPTRLPRKKCNPPKSINTAKTTGIIRIKEIKNGKYVGIEIDGNQRFLINDFTVTHNCTNIFSNKFTVDVDDSKRGKRYSQTWSNNMLNVDKPKITKLSKGKSSVKITFYPDLARFGIKDLNNDHKALFYKRTIDIAGTADNKLKVYFNDKKIEINQFKNYIELYFPGDEVYYDNSTPRWTVGCVYKPDYGAEAISFVNSISTFRAGTHVNHVSDTILKTLINDFIKKKDKDIKITPVLLRENIIFFVNSIIENPSFSSQSKDTLTTKADKFGSKYIPSQAFLKKLAKCGVVEQVIQLAKFKENSNLKKTDGKKQAKITGIPKLDDANKAGTKDAHKCTLILTEGDSAKATAMAGLAVVGRDYYGVFPLKGKLLNVREASAVQILANEEIKNLKIILGLKQGEDYSNEEKLKNLRYGRVLLLTDQDVDGFHIKGLFMNAIHSMWPSLMKTNFIQTLNTPIVKATKGKDIIAFYNLTDYEKWVEEKESKNWKVKYYKGLGTSTSLEAREYFTDIDSKLINYFWVDKPDDDEKINNDCDDAIKLAFEKLRADDRKKWLMAYNKNNILKYENKNVSYYDFIHKELIHFSNDDLNRSIPSVVDGLKPSQRKILFGAFLRGLDKTEVKVAQLAGFVSDKAAYHHGEMSLNGAIIGMAQNFVGSNNINILKPNGQFGSRISNGKDAASSRYIWTMLEDLTTLIFNPCDDAVLNNQVEDGLPIEPEYYAPIIPMVLVNGAEGIGTGFSTKIPCYNPIDIIKNIKRKIKGKELKEMNPWWRGFDGTIAKVDDFNYEIYGTWATKKNKLIITELPIGESTSSYKEFLEKLLDNESSKKPKDDKKKKTKKEKENPFLGYKDNNTDTKVYFELEFEDGYLEDCKDLDKTYHLYKKFSTGNMHLFGPEGHIKYYENINQIIEDYFKVRLELYQKRKDYQLDILKHQLELISYKVKFILIVIDKKIEVNNKKKSEIEEKLEKLKFPKLGRTKDDKQSYDYLLSMPIYNLTHEKIEELKKQNDEKQTEYDSLANKSAKEIWADELDTLLEKYEKWIDKYEKELEDKPIVSKKLKNKK